MLISLLVGFVKSENLLCIIVQPSQKKKKKETFFRLVVFFLTSLYMSNLRLVKSFKEFFIRCSMQNRNSKQQESKFHLRKRHLLREPPKSSFFCLPLLHHCIDIVIRAQFYVCIYASSAPLPPTSNVLHCSYDIVIQKFNYIDLKNGRHLNIFLNKKSKTYRICGF